MSNDNSLAKLANSISTSKKTSALDAFLGNTDTVFLLIDTSGSMASPVSYDNPEQRRIDALRIVVSNLQQGEPIPMIAFGGPWDAPVRFVDLVPEPEGGTPLHSAIEMAKTYGATRLVVISDGMPDLREQSLTAAREFGGRIDVVFIGAGENDPGSMFMNELARATGGTRQSGDASDTKALTGTIIGLLEGNVDDGELIVGEGFKEVAGDAVIDAEEDDTDEDDDDEDEEDEDDDE